MSAGLTPVSLLWTKVRGAVNECVAGEFSMSLVHDGSVFVSVTCPPSARFATEQAVDHLTDCGLCVTALYYDEDGRRGHFRVTG